MTTLRYAGYSERRCIARDINGAYGWIVTVGRYSHPSGVDVEDWESRLANAVSRCVEWHPALSCCVKDSTSKQPLIAKLDSVNIEDHIRMLPFVANEDSTAVVTTLLMRAHAEPFVDYETAPQWRVWSQPFGSEDRKTWYVAFACSHVLLDGMSATFFHRTLDHALSSRLFRGTEHKLLPSLDQAVKMPISWSFLLKPLIQEKLPSSITRLLGLSKEYTAWHGAEQRPKLQDKSIKTAVKVLMYHSGSLNHILRTCRLHKSKLTALLNLLLAKSLANALADEGRACTAFRSSVPYDLRRLIAGSEQRMANYSSATQGDIIVENKSPGQLTGEDWVYVADETAILQARSSTLNDQLLALLIYLSDFNEWVMRQTTTPSGESFSISNLGNYKPDGTDSWISQMIFSQSADATGAPINVNVASMHGHELAIVLTWWPGMLGIEDEQAFIDRVSTSLAAWLKAVADESADTHTR